MRNRRLLAKKPLSWACEWLRGIASLFPVYYRTGSVLLSLAASNATTEGIFSATTTAQSRSRASTAPVTLAAETVLRSQRNRLIEACRNPAVMEPHVAAARVAVAGNIRVRRPRGVAVGMPAVADGSDDSTDSSSDS